MRLNFSVLILRGASLSIADARRVVGLRVPTFLADEEDFEEVSEPVGFDDFRPSLIKLSRSTEPSDEERAVGLGDTG